MEALVAVGLAANVLQFGELALKLTREAKTIYRSASGMPEKAAKLHNIAKTLQASTTRPICPNEPPEWKKLRLHCHVTADQLLNETRKLQTSPGKSRTESIRVALKSISKTKKLDILFTELESTINLISHLKAEFWNEHQTSVKADLRVLATQLDEQGTKTERQLAELCRAAQKLASDFNNKANASIDTDQLIQEIAQKVSAISKQEAQVREQNGILDSLHFESIESRHGQIPEAHKATFAWIHDANMPDGTPNVFQSWLQFGSGVFWLSGNAGSGKSTLMKFIADSHRTHENLTMWSAGSDLLVCAFYFWKPGIEMQKSVRGLLRAMLYQVFYHCPDLMRDLVEIRAPVRENWTTTRLRDTLRRLSQHPKLLCDNGLKICIFIDGLDEYEGHTDAIMSIVEVLSMSLNIKICISSRPLNHLKSFFAKLSVGTTSSFQLQDLTRNDISNFVSEKLDDCSEFSTTFSSRQEQENFKSEVATKAEGVFLWADLAVQNLLNAMVNGDTLSTVKSKLACLPDSGRLDNMFQRMIEDVARPQYREEATAIFRICALANDLFPSPLYLMALPFIDTTPTSTEAENNMGDDGVEVDRLIDMAERRLNARCNGLVKCFRPSRAKKPWGLGVSSNARFEESSWTRPRASFIHRSVVEFLEASPTCNFGTNRDMTETCDLILTLAEGVLRVLSRLLRFSACIGQFLTNIRDIFDTIQYLYDKDPTLASITCGDLYRLLSQHANAMQINDPRPLPTDRILAQLLRRGYTEKIDSSFLEAYWMMLPIIFDIKPHCMSENHVPRSQDLKQDLLQNFAVLAQGALHLISSMGCCAGATILAHYDWGFELLTAHVMEQGLDRVKGWAVGKPLLSWEDPRFSAHRMSPWATRRMMPLGEMQSHEHPILDAVGGMDRGDSEDEMLLLPIDYALFDVAVMVAVFILPPLIWRLEHIDLRKRNHQRTVMLYRRFQRIQTSSVDFLREVISRLDDINKVFKLFLIEITVFVCHESSQSILWLIICSFLDCGADPNCINCFEEREWLKIIQFRRNGIPAQHPRRFLDAKTSDLDPVDLQTLIDSKFAGIQSSMRWSFNHSAWEICFSFLINGLKPEDVSLRGNIKSPADPGEKCLSKDFVSQIIERFLQAGATPQGQCRIRVGDSSSSSLAVLEIAEILDDFAGGKFAQSPEQFSKNTKADRSEWPDDAEILENGESGDEAWFSAEEFVRHDSFDK